MDRKYSKEELEQLHVVLLEILSEIVRVCNKLNISYFIQGGTAIGAYFENNILPWDDDIDVGMLRSDYERFLSEAPSVLDNKYFLSWIGSDPNTPFYFAKVRKNNTTFLEENCKNIKMHHGIFVDIFPFDKIPDDAFKAKLQRKMSNHLSSWLIAKNTWPWKYCGKCDLENPDKKGFLDCLFTRIISTIIPKNTIYSWLCNIQKKYNTEPCTYYNIVMTNVDQIPVVDIENMEKIMFGEQYVNVPAHLEEYLHHHYGKNIQRTPPIEKQINHAPLKLSFTEEVI